MLVGGHRPRPSKHPQPAPPVPLPVIKRLATNADPNFTTNIVGTNVVICGQGKVGPYHCVTNPPVGPGNTGTRVLTWTVTNWTGTLPLPVYNTMLCAPTPNGPWSNAFAVLITNSNMAVNVTVDLKASALFFKPGTNLP